MKRRTALILTCGVLSWGVIWAPAIAAPMTFRTVSVTDAHAPGADPDVVFSVFHHPAINSSGLVVFMAVVDGDSVTVDNETGIWAEEGAGGLRLVARAGDVAPGTDGGQVFDVLGRSVINDAGRTAVLGFSTDTGGGGSLNEGVWVETETGLHKAALVGDLAPGSNATFDIIAMISPALNGPGGTSLVASLSDSSFGVWSGVPGAMETVVSTSNTDFLTIGSLTFPTLNDGGQTVIMATRFTFGLSSGVWIGDADGIDTVAVAGDAAAGTSSTFCDFGFGFGIGNPSINGSGRVVFRATISECNATGENNIGVWTGSPGDVSLVTRSGEHAPGTGEGVVFSDFSFTPSAASLLINGDGDTAFHSALTGPGVAPSNDHGVWVHSGDELRLVARAGDHAPGTPEGVRFRDVGGALGDLGHTLNSSGQVALQATLIGMGVDTLNDKGVWAEVDGALQLVVREGDEVGGASGNGRAVDQILSSIVGSGNEDGRASVFNDLGQVVFSVSFTDSSGGVFVADTVGVANTPGDADGDGDVDLLGYVELFDCLNGPDVEIMADCLAYFDSDTDSDVDLRDVAFFQTQFAGALTP